MARTFLMSIYKSSRWCKLLLLILTILIFFIGVNSNDYKEGFINQQQKFKFIQGPQLYDNFYSNIYDDILTDSVVNEYEVGEIINKTGATNESLVLDIGSGTGSQVNLFNQKNIPAFGLDISPSMVSIARNNYPNHEFRVGDATNIMIYPAHTFSHITCLNNTIYEMKDRAHFIKNSYEWLMPGGYFVLQLSNSFNHLNNSKKYDKFVYNSNFDIIKGNIGIFNETFKDNDNKVRKQQRKLFISGNHQIINMVKDEGFILQGQFDLSPVNQKEQIIYLFYKPE
jgi:SAM-dependent methyltransferase